METQRMNMKQRGHTTKQNKRNKTIKEFNADIRRENSQRIFEGT